MTTRPPLIPEQVDRDAAADYYTMVQQRLKTPHSAELQRLTKDELLSGQWDNDPAVQAFASHRLQARREALEEAAKVAETLHFTAGKLSDWINTNESPMGATRRHIAAGILALRGES